MAYKRKTSKHGSEKNNYFDSALTNKISESFNRHLFNSIRGKFSLSEAKEKMILDWSQIRLEAIKSTKESIVDKFGLSLGSLPLDDPNEYYATGNALIDEQRRQSDISLGRARNDVIKTLIQASHGSNNKFDIPWLRKISVAEKFIPFYEKNQRYIFKGTINQIIVANAMGRSSRANSGSVVSEPVVVFMGDIRKIVGSFLKIDSSIKLTADEQIDSFIKTILKGKKSLTSLFVRTSSKIYKNRDGTSWKPSEGEKRPSSQDLSSGAVIERESVNYISQPVWLISDLIENLPSSVREKYDQILDSRVKESDKNRQLQIISAVKDADHQDLNQLVDDLIKFKIDQMAIDVKTGGDRACYFVEKDIIHVPRTVDFLNPIERYATVMHELAHSTKHLANRPVIAPFGSIAYAIEECLAEVSATLMVQDLFASVSTDGSTPIPPLWLRYFNEYFENSSSYTNHWGGEFDLKRCIDQIFDINDMAKLKNGNIVESMVDRTIECFQILSTGKIHNQAISKEMRLSAKERLYTFDAAMD